MNAAFSLLALTALSATALAGLWKMMERIDLSRAKHRSLTGHARMARRVASLIPFYEYDEDRFFRSDDASGDVAARRRHGFLRLSQLYRERYAKTRRATATVRQGVSDLQFTEAYRVPFQYSCIVRDNLCAGNFAVSSQGVTVTDLDGNRFYDLTGSYGVNLFGTDFYKECLERGQERVGDLGPMLGTYHPVLADNVRRLQQISGLDEVSFHMSGTEAVMQAVRLARYHTGRRRVVRFCGAYHGWWGDVQPGIGNPVPTRDTFTLAEMSEKTLRVLRQRRDIACVLVNPLQALHPNAGAPADSALIDSSRSGGFEREAYTAWLSQLRAICSARGIALIFDEVFLGFRIAPGGAQEYFNVRADMVTYGKTLGGGLPVGVLCGRADLMRRFRADRPIDICFARGTFNAHPSVMGAMNAFLVRLDQPDIQALYRELDVWNERARRLNMRFDEHKLPVRVANLSSVWTVYYTRPSRYNWMLQYYLRTSGLALSWVGTGRLIFSLNYTEADFDVVADRFIAAATEMEADGWWSGPETTNASIKRRVLRETLAAAWAGRSKRSARPQTSVQAAE